MPIPIGFPGFGMDDLVVAVFDVLTSQLTLGMSLEIGFVNIFASILMDSDFLNCFFKVFSDNVSVRFVERSWNRIGNSEVITSQGLGWMLFVAWHVDAMLSVVFEIGFDVGQLLFGHTNDLLWIGKQCPHHR